MNLDHSSPMYGHYTAPGYVRQPTLDGYGEQWTPARIVYNGLGEPVGAFPALAALLPLAAKAVGAIAPVAAKAAGAIMPAVQSALPMLANQGLPSLLNLFSSGGVPQIPGLPQLSQLVPGLPPVVPATSPAPSVVSPAVVVQPLATPQVGHKHRRRRRHFVRVMRDRGTGTVRAVRPIVPVSPGSPTITASQVTVRPPPPPATESSGGMGGYGYYGNPYGGFHYAGPPAGVYGFNGY